MRRRCGGYAAFALLYKVSLATCATASQEEEEEEAVFEELNAILADHLEQEVPAASANAACEGHQQEHEEKEVEPGLRDRGSFGRYVLGFGRGETEC